MKEYAEEASRVPEFLSFPCVDGLEEVSSRVEEQCGCLVLRLGDLHCCGEMSASYLELRFGELSSCYPELGFGELSSCYPELGFGESSSSYPELGFGELSAEEVFLLLSGLRPPFVALLLVF